MQKSFTLIELLVVIAIVGLIASIVLVNVGGLGSKAKITKSLQFSQSINHVLGADAVGIWSFDNTALDGSGYGNNCTVNGAAYNNNDTPHKAAGIGTGKSSLDFNGTTNYLDCGNNPSLNPTKAITLELWLKPTGFPVVGDYASPLFKGGNNQWYFRLDGTGHKLNIIMVIGAGYIQRTSPNVIPSDRFTHAVATYNGSSLTLYIDGVAGAPVAASGNIGTIANNLIIGAGWVGGWYFKGLIDEVRIYEKALTLGEIQKHYAEGLERHPAPEPSVRYGASQDLAAK